MAGTNHISRITLREQAVIWLKEKILAGEYEPGRRVVETEISEALGISRGPIREALRQLEEEELISYLPHKGCVVKTLSYKDMQESYLIRCTLEALAVRICSGKLDREMYEKMLSLTEELKEAAKEKDMYRIVSADEAFHSCIVEAARCSKLLKIWKSMESVNIAAYFTMKAQGLMPYDRLAYNHRYILDGFNLLEPEELCKRVEKHYLIVPQTLYENNPENKQN